MARPARHACPLAEAAAGANAVEAALGLDVSFVLSAAMVVAAVPSVPPAFCAACKGRTRGSRRGAGHPLQSRHLCLLSSSWRGWMLLVTKIGSAMVLRTRIM